MIWLALLWVGLIALWGVSDTWRLASVRAWALHAAHALRHHGRPRPFDWSDGTPSGPRPAGSRW